MTFKIVILVKTDIKDNMIISLGYGIFTNKARFEKKNVLDNLKCKSYILDIY